MNYITECFLPDVRMGSNDVRSGFKSHYESIDMEEHGHVPVSIAVLEY